MRKYLYLALATVLLGLTACSSDGDGPIDPEKKEKDIGADNYSDPAVTGGRQDVFYLTDNSNSGIIAVDIAGYLNLTAELKVAIGLLPDPYGIELSTSPSFTMGTVRKFAAKQVEDNRKFIVSVTGLAENTTYYFRTYLTNSVFGSTRSFTTESNDAVASKMTIPTADAASVSTNSAVVHINSGNTGVAYAKDKSLLTADNIKRGTSSGIMLSTSGSLSELASGTVYYYCEYRRILNYVIPAEVKSFTTQGENAGELSKNVTVNASYNESTYVWSATITTSLGSKFPGKNIKYGIMPYLKTDMANEGYIACERFGKEGDGFVYATGSGTTYSATSTSPEYYGMGIKGSNELVEPRDEEDMLNYEAEALGYIEKSKRRDLTPDEEARYYDLIGLIRDLYPGYFGSVHNVLAVYVEIDGVKYNVKEQEGKLRLPWYLQ